MRRKVFQLCILVLLVLLSACKPSGPELEPLDLLSQGIPLKVKAPSGVEVTSSDLGIMKDVTIKDQEGYSIQIFESEASSLDVANVLQKIKSDIESSKFFSEIVEEEEGGFIFEKKIDESYITYDFRHVKILGDKQYVIQAGMSGQHTLDQVKIMFDSVM